MSDGGTFSYVTGLERASPFTHLAPIAATFHPLMAEMADAERLRGLPIHIVHGALDWMFPVQTARITRDVLTAAGANVTYREIDNLSHCYPREMNAPILKWLGGGNRLRLTTRPAIGAQHLAVDPSAIGAVRERKRRRRYPPACRAAPSAVIFAMRSTNSGDLPARNKLGRDRARRHRIDRDVTAAQFLRKDGGHRLHRGLGRGIDAVGLELGADDAGGEIDDATAVAQAPRRLPHPVKAALEIDRDLLVERSVIAVGDFRKLHDAGIVDEHVDAAECLLGRLEHVAHQRRHR